MDERRRWARAAAAAALAVHFVDTHCHIERYPKPLDVLKSAESAHVVTVAVTEVPSDFQRLTLRLGRRHMTRVALGLHPLRAGTIAPMELALFTRLLDKTDYVGEVGLDRSSQGRPSFRAQVKVFEHLLSQPRLRQKVLTVHSRGAESETIELLATAGPTAILHWYSGPLKHLDAALSVGLWFSVNPAMLRSKNGQRIVAALPPDRVVTETDGPYTKVGGRPAEPRDVPTVVAGLARLWNRDADEVRDHVYRNMTALSSAAKDRSAPE